MPTAPIRLLLVHDRVPANLPVLRAVEALDAFTIVGTVWTIAKAQHAMRVASPELALVDWGLVSVSASQMCHAIKTRLLAPKVIVLVPDDAPPRLQAVALAGADAHFSRLDLEAGLARALAELFPGRARAPDA